MSDNDFESAFSTAAAQSLSATPPPVDAPPPAAPDQIVAPPPVATPSPDPQPVASPPVPEQVAVAPPTNPLHELARQAGIQFGETATPDELARLAISQLQAVAPMANYARQLLPHASEFQHYLESRQQQQPTAPAADEWTQDKYFQEQWGSSWDDRFSVAIERGMVQRDPTTNLWVPSPGYEMSVAAIIPQLNDAQQKQSENWQEITRSNPYQHFYEKLHEPMRRAWQADVQQAIADQFARVKQDSVIEQFEKQNAAWLYQAGTMTATPQGQKFLSAIDELQKGGVTDPELLLRFAGQLAGQQTGQLAPQPAAPVVPNPVGQSVAQQTSFLQNAIDRSGHTAGSSSNPVAPTNVQETDLNNMFISAFRSTQGQSA
jgi:hypothetical protein